MISNKKGVILNYGMLVQEVGEVIKEKALFISGTFFRGDPALKEDPDLIKIGRAFANLLEAIKDFDAVVGECMKKEL